MILLGTLLYSIVTIIVYLFFPNRPVQESVAKAFCALGNYLDAKSEFFDPDEIDEIEKKHLNFAMKNTNVVDAFNQVRTCLLYTSAKGSLLKKASCEGGTACHKSSFCMASCNC